MPIYKTLSVKQPWAHLIATGRKSVEMRSWKTDYRGQLLITASSSPKNKTFEGQKLPAGGAICLVDLVDIRLFTADDFEAAGYEGEELREMREDWIAEDASGNEYAPVYAWVLANPRPVEFTPIKGKLHIFEVELEELKGK